MSRSGFSRNVVRGVCALTEFVLSCGVNFFTSLYMHPWEQENNLILRRKKKEAEVDIAIDTVSRSIESLDVNIALLKVSIERSPVEPTEHNKFSNELISTQMQRDDLRYLLGALRGRLDAQRLTGAVKTLADSVGLQLNASAYINRQVLTLAMQRDLDDMREPVTRVTVEDAYQEYSRARPGTEVDVV
ncbi:hypothetical protein KUCAC02_007734 [Chaenocephalus aceratus]|uniref:Uncharacterized protein n=1 Tax=Chaenocephalus aceratus TaxID=36190 RepID=A0ACB9X813_CHAAC|nr:hypothetical protein KUCAC02_007734 [Chaenocephalus aceratus]